MKDTYKSILVIVLGFCLIAEYYQVREIYFGALGLGLLSLVSAALARKIVWAWFKLSEGMGWFMSRVLLSLVFFLALTPIAFVQKVLSKKDSLMLKKTNRRSTFSTRNHRYTQKDLKEVW